MNENMYAAITGIPAGFKAFVGAMQERLEARYPDCEVRAVQTDKNNGVRLTGIAIMQDGENVTPNMVGRLHSSPVAYMDRMGTVLTSAGA